MASTEAIDPTSEKINGIDKWEVESAADTLVRANEIKTNPKLIKAVRKVLQQRLAATKTAVGSLKKK